MRLLGWEWSVDTQHIVIAVGAFIGGGACYAILQYCLSSRGPTTSVSGGSRRLKRKRKEGERDKLLPLFLEQEYGGDLRRFCLSLDPHGAAYLDQFPSHFFLFPQSLLKFVSNFVADHTQTFHRALIIGSRTGYLTFALATIFDDVTGIEPSFSQVVTCYQFQNLKTVSSSFPVEGAQSQLGITFRSPIESSGPFSVRKKSQDIRRKNKEGVNFIYADLDQESLLHLGSFQLVVVQNCLEDLEEPLKFVESLNHLVADEGFLVISGDYNWSNKLGTEKDSSSIDSFKVLRQQLESCHFELTENKNIVELVCESVRSSCIRNNHVTGWRRGRFGQEQQQHDPEQGPSNNNYSVVNIV